MPALAHEDREALSRLVEVLMPRLGTGEVDIYEEELIEYMSHLDKYLVLEASDALSHQEGNSGSPIRVGLVGSSRTQRGAVTEFALRLIEFVYSEASVLVSLGLPSGSLLGNGSAACATEWNYDALVPVVNRGLTDS